MADSLDTLRQRLHEFVAERQWGQFHDPKNLVMALSSEVGELAAEYRWVSTESSDAYTAHEAARLRVTREIGDVGILLLLLADRLGIDLIAAIAEKIELNARKYPSETTKGSPNPP